MSEHKQQQDKADEVQRSPQEASDAGTKIPASASSAAAGAGAQGGPGDRGGSSMGGVQRMEEFGAGTARAGRDALRGAVSTTEELGTGVVGGAAHIATDLVHGVTDLGYEVRNGATGLIGAVGDIGSAAVNTVAGLLVDVVGGVRQVVDAAVHGHPTAPRSSGIRCRTATMLASSGRRPPGSRVRSSSAEQADVTIVALLPAER